MSVFKVIFFRCLKQSSTYSIRLKPIRPNKGLGVNVNRCLSTTYARLDDLSRNNEFDHDFVSRRDFFLQYAPKSLQTSGVPHNVLIIQPSIKWGPGKKKLQDPMLEINEAKSLVNSLASWSVAGTKNVSGVSFDHNTFLRKGQLQEVHEILVNNKSITALFVNTPMLKVGQHVFLERAFKRPVLDRYCVILNIFKQHASSKEAKMLVAKAEFEYFYSRLGSLDTSRSPNSPETSPDVRKQLMADYEQKIRAEIELEKVRRGVLRQRRTKLEIPVVAVVGYTNAGKTSLIRVLTGDEGLAPKDQLFATLDTTVHAGVLPRNLKVLFSDGVGFISDLPNALKPAFAATLEDALIADVVVAIHDASHPDAVRQAETVSSTLKSLGVPEDRVLSVQNKVDLLPGDKVPEGGISCTTGVGLDELRFRIENAVVSALGLKLLTFRVASGSSEFTWLLRETAVYHIDVDPKNQSYCFLSTILSEAKLSIFKHEYVKKG